MQVGLAVAVVVDVEVMEGVVLDDMLDEAIQGLAKSTFYLQAKQRKTR